MIDGHHRYEICTRHGIPFDTVEVALPSREHVRLWIEEQQAGRRNLAEGARLALADSIYERRLALSPSMSERGKRGGRGKRKHAEDVSSSFRLRAEVAQHAKVSEWKLRTFRAIKEDHPDLAAKIRAGEKTIIEVKREIQDRQRQEILEANRRRVAQATPLSVALDGQTFSTIVVDPPWDYSDEDDEGNVFGRARPTYAVMPIEQLLALPIGRFAEQDAHLYLWITNRSLPKGKGCDLLEAWGFRYVNMLTWVKPTFGMGNYFRGSTEHVLFGVRGSLKLLRSNVGTHFAAPRGEHSTKPAEFYSLVEACSPGPWLEVFARKLRPGWTVWGAEVDQLRKAG